MLRVAPASFAMTLLLSIGLTAAAPPKEVTEPIAKELATKVSVDVDETTLSSVARTLAEQTPLTIWVHPTLQKTSVSLATSNTPLADALEQVRRAAVYEAIDWDVNGGVIQLIPQKQHDERYSRVHVYDISSFLLPVVNYGPSHFESSVEFDLTTTSDSGGSIFSDIEGKDELQDQSREERTSQLMDLIRNTVTPDEWRSAGGLAASMEELNGQLVVSAPLRVHERVEQMLDMLSDARQAMVVLDVQLLAMPAKKVDDTLADSANGPVLDGPGLKRLRQNAAEGRRMLARTSMACVSGQRIGTTAGGHQTYTRRLDPLIVTGAVAHDPRIETLYNGLAVIVQPTITRTGRSVDMNLEANATQGKIDRVRRLLSVAAAAMKPAEGRIDARQDEADIDGRIEMAPPLAARGMASTAEYDLPEMDIAQFRSRARVPSGGALMLVASTGQGQLTEEGEVLVLLVQPRIVKLTEKQ